MATKGWKMPYSTDGNVVTTRLSGQREVVFVGNNAQETEEFWLRANCQFQVDTYGAVDCAAWFVTDARARGYPIAPSFAQSLHEAGLLPTDARLGMLRPVRKVQQMPDDTPDDEGLPNKLLGSEISILSFDPLIGVLILATDDGEIEVAINKKGAADLAASLVDFLGAEEGDEEYAANDDDPTH